MVSKNQIHPQTNKHIMEDLKKIQEFFSKPLEENKKLDNTDFTKVVKAENKQVILLLYYLFLNSMKSKFLQAWMLQMT